MNSVAIPYAPPRPAPIGAFAHTSVVEYLKSHVWMIAKAFGRNRLVVHRYR
jgi:hypothetical protein